MLSQIPWWVWLILYIWIGPLCLTIMVSFVIGFFEGLKEAWNYFKDRQ